MFVQAKTISCKIINSDFPSNVSLAKHEFSSVSGAVIMGNGSIRLGIADGNGISEPEIPLNIQTLTIGWIRSQYTTCKTNLK